MSSLSSNASQKINQLKVAYIESLSDKLADINSSWLEITNENDVDIQLENLRVNCHKLAGSAGSYGLKEISNSARTLDKLCNEIKQSEIVDHAIADRLGPSYQSLVTLIRVAIDN